MPARASSGIAAIKLKRIQQTQASPKEGPKDCERRPTPGVHRSILLSERPPHDPHSQRLPRSSLAPPQRLGGRAPGPSDKGGRPNGNYESAATCLTTSTISPVYASVKECALTKEPILQGDRGRGCPSWASVEPTPLRSQALSGRQPRKLQEPVARLKSGTQRIESRHPRGLEILMAPRGGPFTGLEPMLSCNLVIQAITCLGRPPVAGRRDLTTVAPGDILDLTA
jgi:hypothetical protein